MTPTCYLTIKHLLFFLFLFLMLICGFLQFSFYLPAYLRLNFVPTVRLRYLVATQVHTFTVALQCVAWAWTWAWTWAFANNLSSLIATRPHDAPQYFVARPWRESPPDCTCTCTIDTRYDIGGNRAFGAMDHGVIASHRYGSRIRQDNDMHAPTLMGKSCKVFPGGSW